MHEHFKSGGLIMWAKRLWQWLFIPNKVTTINNNKLNVAIIVLQEADNRRGDGLLGRGGIPNYPLSFVNASAFSMADANWRSTKTWCVISSFCWQSVSACDEFWEMTIISSRLKVILLYLSSNHLFFVLICLLLDGHVFKYIYYKADALQ